MTKKLTNHNLDEFVGLLDASEVASIVEYPSAVFTFAKHPQLGEIVGIATPNENFIVTSGM